MSSTFYTVGDLHGDWAKAVGSFRAANVIRIDGDDITWTGGDTVVVQLGDVLDRGDHEIGKNKLERSQKTRYTHSFC
jgi:hypothetical protein